MRRESTKVVRPAPPAASTSPTFSSTKESSVSTFSTSTRTWVRARTNTSSSWRIFGEEFALNLGSPDLSGYVRWLDEHKGICPLYSTGA